MTGTGRLNELSAAEIVQRTTSGEIACEEVVRDCLARIEARETAVKAWAFLDPELALAQARALDKSATRGPLHGVPVAVKDVFDTADMPTGMGSPVYDGWRPAADASCVALVRAAGAVVLGKSVTCEFAGLEPAATVNPRAPGHTPGGSSSGSAAAVADFMAAVGFGSQTGGSVLRPASFCGIVGFKPGFGILSRAGLKLACETLDTVGLFARTVDDAALLFDVLVGRPAGPLAPAASPPRVGLCRTPLWETALPETVTAVEDAANRLAAAGAAVVETPLPDGFAMLGEARETINDYERARSTAWEWNLHRDRLSVRLRASIERGFAMKYETYAAASATAARCRAQVGALFEQADVLLAPCVPGEAPVGLQSTGDPRMQGLWTILYVPALTLPTHKGPKGLPVGIQLVGPPQGETRLLAAARWVWERLDGPA